MDDWRVDPRVQATNLQMCRRDMFGRQPSEHLTNDHKQDSESQSCVRQGKSDAPLYGGLVRLPKENLRTVQDDASDCFAIGVGEGDATVAGEAGSSSS
jgi:hypothetical protein